MSIDSLRLHGASIAATAELARRVTARVAIADMATIPPGAAWCWLVSRRVSGQMALPSRKRAGRNHRQTKSARVTAVLIALAARTGSANRAASCLSSEAVSLTPITVQNFLFSSYLRSMLSAYLDMHVLSTWLGSKLSGFSNAMPQFLAQLPLMLCNQLAMGQQAGVLAHPSCHGSRHHCTIL